MTKLFSTLALLLAPVAASAAPATEHHFTSDGSIFAYTVTEQGDAKVVDGREQTSGRRFHYVVRGRHVVGTLGAETVDFFMPAQPTSREVASR